MGKRKGHIPVRTCVFCGAKRSKHDMVRFVLDEEGGLVQDHAFKMEGRGAYTCKSETCMGELGNGKKILKVFRRLSVKGSRRVSRG
jgi:predicted RNA-binding protein YlxR (DUF448 family)